MTRILRHALGLALAIPLLAAASDDPPAAGDKAADFALPKLGGGEARLSEMTSKGPVALVVLRGYPGYQCPLCTRQVAELIAKAGEIDKAGARVLLVYPGPSDNLQQRAQEFLRDARLPENFTLALDPDYAFTKQYHLRWDAPNETAYPSTFVVDADGTIRFAKVSHSHGGRTSAAEILKALGEAKSGR
jgi:peroxiredoxin